MAGNSQYGHCPRPNWAGGLNCFAAGVWQAGTLRAGARSHPFAMVAAVIASGAGAHQILVGCLTQLF